MLKLAKILLFVFFPGEALSVCLKGALAKSWLYLNCSMNLIKANVEIFSPDGRLFGSCSVPTNINSRRVTCGSNKNLTMNLETNTVYLAVEHTTSFNVFGIWKCRHGFNNEEDSFYLPDECKCESFSENIYGIWCVGVITCIIGILIISYLYGTQKEICGNLEQAQSIIFHRAIPLDSDDAIRICGITFLSDSKLVVADYNNRTLRIYKDFKFSFISHLDDEPRGMTIMFDRKVALTFAFLREIKIFIINESDVEVLNRINLSSLRLGKPFSIAYDNGHFAVEVGEGDDGQIAIINCKGEVIRRISNKYSYAYFTGNTIRLALDVEKEMVYVAAMSKDQLTCLTFDGEIVWKIGIKSPRGIVIASREKIILASKRTSTVYEINSQNGDEKLLLANEKLKGPRYISYHNKEKLLCVQVADEIQFYFYDVQGRISTCK